MPINILMPALSPTMEKGNLAKWLKKEGDPVKTGDVIAEIETDKPAMEYEAIESGTLAKIVVPEGTNDVPVNQLTPVLAEEGEDVKAAAAAAKSAPAAKAPSAVEAKPKPAQPAVSSALQAPKAPTATPQPAAAPAQRRDGGEPARTNGGGLAAGAAPAAGRIFASPLARRLAQEAGIEIGRIQGSGPHGRVIARDIGAAREGRGLRTPAAAPGGAAVPMIAPAMSDQQIRALYEEGSYELVPHDGMRRTIAARLTASAQTIPHFYLTIDCDIGKLLQAREEINATAPKDKDGKPAYKLSVNDFVIKALALALQRIPDANVSWTEAGMLKHRHSDIGVAVAMPNGFITPIIRNAQSKSLSVILKEKGELASRGRARQPKPQEYQGGTTADLKIGREGDKGFNAGVNTPPAH